MICLDCQAPLYQFQNLTSCKNCNYLYYFSENKVREYSFTTNFLNIKYDLYSLYLNFVQKTTLTNVKGKVLSINKYMDIDLSNPLKPQFIEIINKLLILKIFQ